MLSFLKKKKKIELKAGIYHPRKGSSQNGLVDRIIELSKDVDIFFGPEYLLKQKSGLYTQEEKNSILKKIAEETEGSLVIPGTILWHDDSSVYNTCPIIYRGNIHEYNKYNQDLVMQSSAKEHDLRVGFGSGQKIHEWNNLKFIVEICLDQHKYDWHNFGDETKPADMYFLTSYDNIIFADVAPVNKGVLFYSDGVNGLDCLSKNKSKIKQIPVTDKIKEETHFFYCFDIVI